jgi:AraC-like DNA-binding protein
MDVLSKERIHEVINYADEHYQEPISLDDVAGHVGLDKKYFCRFFKQNMGMTFLQYLTEMRLAHIYQELISTGDSVSEITERNGMTNQKLFNRTFKELYGCTPSQVRNGQMS